MRVSDLSTDELKALIRETVAESIAELLADPDIGLEIRDDVRLQLLEQRQAVLAGERGKSLDDVVASLGL